jgi:hypothetical protein
LLVTLLRLQFIVLVLFLVIYFYLCSFNYELFFLVVFLGCFLVFFRSVRGF